MADKIGIRNYLKFNGLNDDQINNVPNWGNSFENREGVGYANEDDIQNAYAKSKGLTWARGALNNAGIDNKRIGYDYTSGNMTLDGRITDLGNDSVTIGGKNYARPDMVNNLLGPRLTPNVSAGLNALGNSMDPEKAKSDPLYQAYTNQINNQTLAAQNAAGRDLAARGVLGGGSQPAAQRYNAIQMKAANDLMTQAMPTVMNQVWSRNMGMLDKTMGAEQQAGDSARADSAITGTYNGAPTMAAQTAEMSNLWPALQNTGAIPNMDAMMAANPAYRGILSSMGQFSGQQTAPMRSAAAQLASQENIAYNHDATTKDVSYADNANRAAMGAADNASRAAMGAADNASREKIGVGNNQAQVDAAELRYGQKTANGAANPATDYSVYLVAPKTRQAYSQLDQGIRLMAQQNNGKMPNYAQAQNYLNQMLPQIDPGDRAWMNAMLAERYGYKPPGQDNAKIIKGYRNDQPKPPARSIFDTTPAQP